MNTQVKFKIIQYLNNKKYSRGFTLIELLVVVIIIGVLAAIALPNLLSQTAKGRQAEAKNNLGAMNRAQQAYRLEYTIFAPDETDLPVKFTWQYYNLEYEGEGDQTMASYNTTAKDQYKDDILDYDALVVQSPAGVFDQVICEELSLNSGNGLANNFAIPDTTAGTASCDTTASKEVTK